MLNKILLFEFFTSALAVSSLSRVQVYLRQPSQNKISIEDLRKLTLINNRQESYSVYLKGVVTETQKGELIKYFSFTVESMSEDIVNEIK